MRKLFPSKHGKGQYSNVNKALENVLYLKMAKPPFLDELHLTVPNSFQLGKWQALLQHQEGIEEEAPCSAASNRKQEAEEGQHQAIQDS